MLAIAGLATPGQARWSRAETTHFVVYSDDRDENIRTLATDLELFDAALRRFHATPEQDGTGSNKLTVFVVDNIGVVQRLCGRCPNVAGFYEGRASGSVAFTPRYLTGQDGGGVDPRTVLFHEYAHHFMFGNYAYAYPAWFSEGYAEFASTFRRDKSGLTIGAPANHRAYGLFSDTRMPATRLFDPNGRKLTTAEQELIYGRGWLLTHYIMFDRPRRAQLTKYLALFNSGTPSVAAATQSFGDLTALDQNLDRYLKARTISALTVKAGVLPEPAVALRALSPGEAALIDLRIVSKRGVNDRTSKPLLARAAPIAARFPDDAVVQAWMAEIAVDAGDLAAADTAADRALAHDPKSGHALLYKGVIALRRAVAAKDNAALFAAARRYVVQANQVDPNNAEPLSVYYQSYALEGRTPSRNAVNGLLRAQELAPQDDDLRFAATAQSIRDGNLAQAKALLKPLAYSPHNNTDNRATQLLTVLERPGIDQAAAILALEVAIKPAPAPTTN